MKKGDIFVIQVAAGEGVRWEASLPKNISKKTSQGSKTSKTFFPLLGKPILIWPLLVFEKNPNVGEVWLVLNKKDISGGGKTSQGEKLINFYKLSKVKRIIEGGKSRQESVYNALKLWKGEEEFVMIHDGVRPFINSHMITELREALLKEDLYFGAIFSLSPRDTVKYIKDKEIVKTLHRTKIGLAQTPQLFRRVAIIEAYSKLKDKLNLFSDDSSMVELFGKVLILPGREENIKITTYYDLLFARSLIKNLWKRR